MSFEIKSKQKIIFIILLFGMLLIALICLTAPPKTPFTTTVASPEDAEQFLNSLGWEVDISQIEITQSILPKTYDSIFTEYNELQKQQNCDLTAFSGKEITVYTIPVTNYGVFQQTVYATLIIYNKQVIGGDIHSADMNGFMHTLL